MLMTESLLGVKGKSPCNVSKMASTVSADSICNGSGLKEHNYLGLSECSSVDSSVASNVLNENKKSLTLKATELRLGLPESQSPERESDFPPTELDEKQLFPLVISNSQKTVVFGNKRGFSDGVSELSNSKTTTCTEVNWIFKPGMHSDVPAKTSQKCDGKSSSNTNNPPAAKIQAVGWPPIRSSRKNIMSMTSKNNGVDRKPSSGTLFVKVSMEGAPYLRKVDLKACSTYKELSSALENMFDCFITGQCGPQGPTCKEVLTEGKLKDLINGSDYALTYEDKDGDWMLVGDVPWEMFIASCKRLKIMKGSEAIGLAPSAVDKLKKGS